MSEAERLSENLLAILVCPICRTKVDLSGGSLLCGGCGRVYLIRDGIPDMVVDRDDAAESRE